MRKRKYCRNANIKLATIILAFLISAYFVMMHFVHEDYKNSLKILESSIPTFFNRYRYLILTWAMLRERVFFNNSLATFESEPGYGHNLDLYYHE
jgi:hypothetical protein